MSRLYLILFSILIPFWGMMQNSGVFGSPTADEYTMGITADNDENIYLAASIDNKGWLIKRNPQNGIVWSNLIQTFSQYDSDISFVDVIGDTVFGCGWIKSGTQILGGMFFKVNATTGIPYWIKSEAASKTYFSSMCYANGKYFLTGSEVNGATGYNGKICAVSSSTGATIWQTPSTGLKFPGYNIDYVDDLISATDMVNGKMFITGRSYVNGASGYNMRILLIGVSETGTIFLTKYLLFDHTNTSSVHRFYGMGIEYDGDSLVIANFGDDNCINNCAEFTSGIIKTDLSGNVGWARHYTIQNYAPIVARGINVTPTGYVMYGTSNFGLPTSNIFMLKTNKSGFSQSGDVLIMEDPFSLGSISATSSPWNVGGSSCYRNGKHYFPGNYLSGGNRDMLQVIVDESLYDPNSFCLNMMYPADIQTNSYVPFSGNLNKVDLASAVTFSNAGQIINQSVTDTCLTTITFQQTSGCGSTEITAYANELTDPSFTWSNGSTNQTVTANSTDPLTVSVTNSQNCCVAFAIVTPTFASGAVNSAITANICAVDTYNFNGELLNQQGIYIDTITTANGCDSIVILTLNILPYIHHSYSATICQGDQYLFNGNLLSQAGSYTDTLITSCDSIVTLTLSVSSNSFSLITETICEGESFTLGNNTYTLSGNYNDTLSSASGCDSIITLSLTVLPLKYSTMNESICAGEDFAFAGTHYIHPGTYTHHFPTSTCDSIVTLHLTVIEPAVDIYSSAYETDSGIFVQLNAISAMSPLDYVWTSSAVLSGYTIPNPTTTIEEETWIYVTVTDTNGCTATDGMLIRIPLTSNLYIPNSFTPNGDEMNQLFRVYGTNIGQFELTIYNRWGEAIFETTDINYGWDGTYNGKLIQDGTYVYKVLAIGMDYVTYDKTGHITVLK